MDIPVLQNTVSKGGRNHGDVVNFKCLAGYQLIGKSMITCKDGAWSDEYPSCVTDLIN
jgi:hypothetical protein